MAIEGTDSTDFGIVNTGFEIVNILSAIVMSTSTFTSMSTLSLLTSFRLLLSLFFSLLFSLSHAHHVHVHLDGSHVVPSLLLFLLLSLVFLVARAPHVTMVGGPLEFIKIHIQ